MTKRRSPSPQILDDGTINPVWVRVDPATGCHIWLGSCSGDGPSPQARHGGRVVHLRRLAWKERHGADPPTPVSPACGKPRCLNADHLVPLRRLTGTERADILASEGRESVGDTARRLGIDRAVIWKVRGGRGSRRVGRGPAYRLRARIPSERPAEVGERDWAVVRALAGGRTARDVAAATGLSISGVVAIARRVLARLGLIETSAPASPAAIPAIVTDPDSP
jgi:hypothetical protein